MFDVLAFVVTFTMIPGTIGVPNGEFVEAMILKGLVPQVIVDGIFEPDANVIPSPEITLGQVIEQSEGGPPVWVNVIKPAVPAKFVIIII